MKNSDLKKYYVSTFYNFQKLNDPQTVKNDLVAKAKELNVKGLIITGTEGFNSTISCESESGFQQFKEFIQSYFQVPHLFFKDSTSSVDPFRRFVVKIRDEIVTLGTPELVPNPEKNHHLTPQEWNDVLKKESDYLLIDTRNWYETQIGTFKGAVNPGIDKFTEFPEFVEKNQIPKDKKMLIFCTGGIRCEKGILELQRQGFDNVYQLEGGIINYLKEFPNDQYEGECFVFDHRVALDQNLNESKIYGLCPHCGQPAKQEITCSRCDHHQHVCDQCLKLEFKKETCSKNCAYQLEHHPKRKIKQVQLKYEKKKQDILKPLSGIKTAPSIETNADI